MTSSRAAFLPNRLRRPIAAVAAGVLLVFSLVAAAQETRPAPPPPARQAAPAHQPGMLDGVGRWFKDSYNYVSGAVEGARNTIGARAGGAADAAKDAADAVARLPGARVVEGRERCLIAANGAPDCRKAAENVCKAKGFGSGSSLDIQSAQKCPARIWLSGRSPEPGDCETQSFVTRAMCQ